MSLLATALGAQQLGALLGAQAAAAPQISPLISPQIAADPMQAQLLEILLSGGGTISLCSPVANLFVSPVVGGVPTLQFGPGITAGAQQIAAAAVSPFAAQMISPLATSLLGAAALGGTAGLGSLLLDD